MQGCPACGAANPDEARFCASCGSTLTGVSFRDPLAGVGKQSRRTVTVIFADVVGSTELGERLDPEAARTVLSHFYDLAKATIERHGGVVEKYIGDAVMGVFGIPTLHEDDALRAARAGLELQDLLGRDDAPTTTERGERLAIRIGVNTGDVIVGDPSSGTTLVTGDAVNVAARLQAAAGSGEILLGPETVQLIHGSADLGPLESFNLKGKAEVVFAARLLALGPSNGGRRTGGPFVGRKSELATLRDAFASAVHDRAATLVTVIGPPGAGKSRLVAEFQDGVGQAARVLTGRCLSYGEGITYWAISEIVRSAASIAERDSPAEARAKIDALVATDPEGPAIAGRVAAAIGVDPADAVPEETPWAIRRLLEIIASEQPLVVLVDDIQWADPGLLDLLEYVLGWALESPLLVICLARPEFRDRRPDWGDPLTTARLIRLGALDEVETGSLLDELAGGPLPSQVRERIVRISDGNPLFAEELLTMLLEEGHVRRDSDDGWVVVADLERMAIPPTVGALLAARLGRLPVEEQDVLTRSSVIGEQFDRAAALELARAPERPAVPGRLLALVRKELLRPDRSDLLGGEAFRFRHLLFRDAAYEALAKADRAILHEKFADWLARIADDRVGEVEAIVGYHYEQAHAYRIALEMRDARTLELAGTAARHLDAAGRRSMDIGDMGAAANTLGRAVALLDRSEPNRIELVGLQSVALMEVGQQTLAAEVTGQALEDARTLEDERLILHAQINAGLALVFGGGDPDAAGDTRGIAARFAELGDLIGEAKAWQLYGYTEFMGQHVASATEAFERGRALARSGGDRQLERRALAWGLPFYGPAPVGPAIQKAQDDLVMAKDDRLRRCEALVDLGLLHALEGDLDQARAEITEARAEFQTLGRLVFHAASCEFDALVELEDGDLARAARALEDGIAELEGLDKNEFLNTELAMLSLVRALQGDAEEAKRALARYQEVDAGRDLSGTYLTERARAHLAAGVGDFAAAVDHAAASVAVMSGSDSLVVKGDAELDLATFRHMAGDIPGALSGAQRALALHRAKGHLVGAARAERLLAELAL
jgi:class 3 adenylate cyclase